MVIFFNRCLGYGFCFLFYKSRNERESEKYASCRKEYLLPCIKVCPDERKDKDYSASYGEYDVQYLSRVLELIEDILNE